MKTTLAYTSVLFAAMGLSITCGAQSASAADAQPGSKIKVPLDANGKLISPRVSDFTKIHFGAVIPNNFLPPYPGSTVGTFANSTKGAAAANLSATTRDSPDTVLKWYRDYLAKEQWQVRTPADGSMQKLGKQGTLNILNAQKDKQQVTIVCIKSAKTGQTIISISWTLSARPLF